MRYLTLGELLELYVRIIADSGGMNGIRDLNAVGSSLVNRG